MIPQHIVVDDVIRDLADDAVAFTPEAPVDEALAEQLSQLLSGSDAATGRAAYLVAGPGSGADLRDLGQAVLDSGGEALGLDTVIVRAPESAAVVSDVASRAAIESSQGELLATPDYVEGLRRFLLDMEGAGIGDGTWLLLALAALAAVLAVALVSYMAADRVKLNRLTNP